LLDSASLAYGVVQIPEEIVNDPERHANKIIPKVAPGLGEETDDVLNELGFEATPINSLRTGGAVPADPRRASPAAG
jgi:formyl-CoA transferase